MRVVILTSRRKGTAAYCLPVLLQKADAEIVQVIYNEAVIINKSKYYRQKIRKLLKIGLPGAVNGIRMRKWYAMEEVDGNAIEDIELVCKRNNIPFAVTSGINTAQTIALMHSCRADLGLSLGNGYIPSKIFSIPAYGMLNVHGEILPQFQNAQSVIWQIYEGSSETGYTIHKVDKKIDTGEILKQEKLPIIVKDSLGETVTATNAEILKRSALGLAEVIGHFQEYNAARTPQGQGRSYTTPSFSEFRRMVRNFRQLKKTYGRSPQK
jgi:methionyl-tRNA formyltransferase